MALLLGLGFLVFQVSEVGTGVNQLVADAAGQSHGFQTGIRDTQHFVMGRGTDSRFLLHFEQTKKKATGV